MLTYHNLLREILQNGVKKEDRTLSFNIASYALLTHIIAHISNLALKIKRDEFQYSDFILENYNPHPHIKADTSV